MYKSLEQRLLLNEEFLKKKARGRAAHTDRSAASVLLYINVVAALEQAINSQCCASGRLCGEKMGADASGNEMEGEVDEGFTSAYFANGRPPFGFCMYTAAPCGSQHTCVVSYTNKYAQCRLHSSTCRPSAAKACNILI